MRSRLLAVWIWLIGSIAVIMQFVVQLSSGSMVDGLTYSFHLSGASAGMLAGAYYPVYCILQVPAGVIVSRIGAQKSLIIGMLAASWATMCFAYADHFYFAIFGRFMSGVGLSCCFVSLIYIINHWFKPKLFGLMLGLSETLIILAIMLMELVLPNGVEHLGWQVISKILALSLSGLAIIVTFFMPKIKVTKSKIKFNNVLKSLLVYTKDAVIWGNSIYAGAMFAMITVFEGLWSHPFFKYVWGFSVQQASTCNAYLLIGIAVGAPLSGLLARNKYRYQLMIIIAVLLLISFFTIIKYGHLFPLYLIHSLLFMIGLISSSYVISNSVASARAHDQDKTAVVGWNNMLVVLPAPLIQPVVGWWIDLAKGTSIADHYIYSLIGFTDILLFMFLISAFLMWFGYKYQQPVNLMADNCDI